MSTTTAQQILFIDAAVTDVATLLASIDPSIEVVQLAAGEDGLTQIARALDGRSGIDAVHIISHGEAGALTLGGVRIDAAALDSHAADLATIRAALGANADMLLYGCDVAAGSVGAAFTEALAAATGADIAASTDTTGSALFGGNWTLETHVGSIETNSIHADAYNATLGADSALPSGLSGNGPWNWGGHTFQTRLNGSIDDSDPENPLRAGNKWDRYVLSGVAAGTTVYVYMGNSSTIDDYLQIDRNGTIITQNDDGGDGERSYDAYVSWVYQPGDVIRATTYTGGPRGSYSLYIGTSNGSTPTGQDIGNAPAPAPTPNAAPVFTDNLALLNTYNDSGANDTFSASSGTFTATDATPTSTLRFSGGGIGSFGTLAVAANGAYNYTPDAAAINALAAGQTRTETFTVSVSDGSLASSKNVTISIVGANDAPTMNADVAMPAVLEDAGASSAVNPGRSVSALIGGVFADVDNGDTLGGIVIVGNSATAGHGHWQYSTDGTVWFDVGTVSTSSGLALSAATRLHFVPAADYNGPVGALAVHAADNNFSGSYTSGATRQSFDTTSDAATSGVSVAAHNISTSVTAVNDAPVITSAVPTVAITETAAYDSAAFAASHTAGGTLIATDIDSPVNTLTYAIRGGDLTGSASTGSWAKVGLYGTLSLNAATHAWTYVPDRAAAVNALAAGETGHDVFEFKVTDDAGASSVQVIDMVLTGTNDTPVVAHSIANQSFSGAGSWHYQIPADSITDAEGRGLTYTVDVVDGGGAVIDTITSTIAPGGDPTLASSWLRFDEASRSFSGDPTPAWNNAALTLRVTASDGSASTSTTFALNLSATGNEAPRVAAPLQWHSVHDTHESADFALAVTYGGSTISFDGTNVTVGTGVSGADVASAFQTAFNGANAGYAASIPGSADVLVLTANAAGPRNDFQDASVPLVGGGYSVHVVTEGAAGQQQQASVQFGDLTGNSSFTFDGVLIDLTGPKTGAEVAAAIAQQLSANGNGSWQAVVNSGTPDFINFTAIAAASSPDLSAASFGSDNITSNPIAIATQVNVHGQDAIAEVVQITFGGNYGGLPITIDGVSATVGSSVSAADTAAALAAATYTNYSVTSNGSSIHLVAKGEGDQTDPVASDFIGASFAPVRSAHTDGAGWSYTVPAGTFVDPENATLSYTAFVIDPATGASTALVNSPALSFDATTHIFSGTGTTPSNTLLKVVATDGAGQSASSQFQLAVTHGATTAWLSLGLAADPADFSSGAGVGSYTLPATAFNYTADNVPLHYTATVIDANGSAVATPAWLHFDTNTATFSGNPPNGSADLRVTVTASATGVSSVTTAPIVLHIVNPNDQLVLASPIADQSVASGSVFGFTTGVLFSDPDGALDGSAVGTSTYAAFSATANGQPLSSYGLTMTVNPNGTVTFGGNPSAAEPYLNIVVTGTETNGGNSASTSFTLNLNEAAAVAGTPQALAANNPGSVTISGTATEGQTLTASMPSDADGVPGAGAVHYQWQVSSNGGSSWQDVAPAADGSVRGQGATLVLAESESTRQVRVQAFYNDGGGVAEAPVSNALAIANVNTVGVIGVTGVLTPGETLNVTLADGDGLQTAVPTYQWYRDGTQVTGATYSNYTLTNADGGHTMSVAVSYTDDHGTVTTNQMSGATGVVTLGAVKPTAVNDSASATEASGSGNSVAGINPGGNVLGNDFDTNNNLRTDIPIASVRNGNAEGLGDAASLNGDTYTVAGQYGVLTINRVSGAWSYAVDQSNTMVDALGVGQSLVDSFNYTIGDTSGLFDTAVLNVTVNGANDAPTLVGLPTTAEFVEDISAAIRTSFSIVDPDGGSSFGLQLTVIKGTLRGEDPSGYTRPAGMVISGTDTHVLTITANSMADVQNWLAATALKYTSGPNQNGSLNDTLTYGVRDDNGAFQYAGSTALTVDHDNNPPVVDAGGAATAGNDYTTTFRPRGGEVAVVAADAHITDIDTTDTIMSATVTLATGAYDNLFGTTYETLRSTAGASFAGANSNAITFTGNGTGDHGLTGATTLTLSGTGTRTDYENALKTIVYNDSNPNAFSGPRTVTISVADDSGAVSNTGSFATGSANNLIAVGQRIFINGSDTGYTVGEVVDNMHFVASGPLTGLVPGAALSFYGSGTLITSATQTGPVLATTTILVPWTPVIDMNGDSLAGRDHTVTYTEGQNGVAIATSDASITDQDGNIASVVIRLDNPLNGSAEKLFISSALVTQLGLFGITVAGNNSSTITLSYDSSARPNGVDAAYFQIGLRSVQYANGSDFPDLSARTVSVTSTDVDGNTGVGAHTTINMVGVNDAPNGTDAAVTALEDTPLVLTAANFGFSDIDGNVLAAVKISSLPSAGGLTLDGAAVSSGQLVSLADINAGKLVFMPALDRSGPAHASFGFQVQDNGGTALGGVDLDPVANTLTINVTPVNDAPVLTAAAPHLATIGENALNNAGQLVSSFVGSGVGHTGVADVDTLNGGGAGSGSEAVGQGIAIHGLSNDGPATGGNWQYSINGGSSWVNVGTVSDGVSLLLRATDMIRFQPDGLNATTATISYYLWDGASGTAGSKVDVSVRGGSSAFSSGSDTSSISVTPANDAPVIDLNGSAGGTDLTTIFRPRGDAVSVVGNDIVITDPDHLAGGADDTLVSAVVTLTGGALDNLFGTTYETLSSTSVASFAGSLGAIAFTGNGTGANGLTGATALTLTGAGTHADYQNALKTIVYNNTNPNAYSGDRTVTIVVHDASATTGVAADGLNSATATTTIQVPWTPVVDMNGDNAAGRNGAVTFVERSAGVAIASADASIVDQDGNIKSVTVTLSNHPDGSAEKLSISSALVTQLGSLGLTITGLNSHQIVITGNKDGSVFQLALRAIQYSNSSAAPSPADRVVTVNSVDMSDNTGVGASTIIHITTINDAPVGVNGTLALTEDVDYAMRVQDFGYTDIENHALASVIITTLPSAGSLMLNGVAVVAGQEVTAAAIAAGQLVYHPVLNANNVLASMPTLGFQVRDAGGVANGGIDLDASANTLTLNIAPVNDLPTAANGQGTPSVIVNGMLQQGQVLNAIMDIADVDRTAPQVAAATTYQWQVRDVPNGQWTDITGATASSFTLTSAEANHEIRVVATYADDIAISSVLSYSSDHADAPAIVADANGNIVLNLDTDEPILITDPIGDIIIVNDGNGPVTIEHFPHGHTLTYDGDGPVTLTDPLGDVAIDSDGPGDVTVTGLPDDATVHTAGNGDVVLSDPLGSVTLGNDGPGTVTVTSLNDGETLHTGGAGPTTVSNPDGDLGVDAAGPGVVSIDGLNDDATLSSSGSGDINVNDPHGSVTLDNGGPGVVTIDGLNDDASLHLGGTGETTVANPDGDLTIVNAGPGVATVTGLNDDATLSTSGPGNVSVSGPEGDVTLHNGGTGTVNIDAIGDGGTLSVGGDGDTSVSNPQGDLTVASAGPGVVEVLGLNDDATVHSSGNGNLQINDPEGSLNLANDGPGAVDVNQLNDGATLSVGGSGPTTVSAPDGDLTVNNAGPGAVDITSLNDGATLHSAGAGDILVSDPDGSVTLDNAGPGEVLVNGLNDGETVHVSGNGPTTIDNPDGDLAVDAAGPGAVVVTSLHPDATVTTGGDGGVTVQDPQGSLNLANAGPGTATVNGLNDGETLHTGGAGPTTVSNPDGDLVLANDGPGLASVTGLHDGATIVTSGAGPSTVSDPLGSVTLQNQGPGTVTVDGVNSGDTVQVAGDGPTTVSNPDGDLTIFNAGPGVASVTGLNDGATLHASGTGDIVVDHPEGALNLDNAGPGSVTVDHVLADQSVHVGGTGPTTLSNPEGNLALANDGPGTVTVSGLAAGVGVLASGAGNTDITDPAGDLTLFTDGPGVVTVSGINDGAALSTMGAGDTSVSNPDGDLTIQNGGPGVVSVSGLQLDATLHTSGNGAVNVDDPAGSLTLENAGNGPVTVAGLNNGETLHVGGNGPTVLANPDGDLAIDASGPGATTVTGLQAGAAVSTSGNGNVTVSNPDGTVNLDNAGPGSVTVDGLHDGDSVHVGGAGPTIVSNPVGTVIITNDGPGLATITGLHDGAIVGVAGQGDVTVSDPQGSLYLDNAGPGTATIAGLHDGATVHSEGRGTTVVSNPVGNVAIDAFGPGLVSIAGLADGANISTSGNGDVAINDPSGSVTLDNAGPGAVTVDGINPGETLHAGGNGPTTLADPDGDVSIVNDGPATVSVTGLHAAAVVNTSGDGHIDVSDPQGSLTLNNAGAGSVTVGGINDGDTVHVAGGGATLVANPDGDVTVANDGPGVASVSGLNDGATLHSIGAGRVDIDNPEGSVNLDNAGPGTVAVQGLGDGAAVNVGGAGPTQVNNPAGDLGVVNDGPGVTSVNGLRDGAVIDTAGNGDVLVSGPQGSVNLNAAGTGSAVVDGIHAGETLHVSGNGASAVTHPQGDLTVANDGPGATTVTGLHDGALLSTSGDGSVSVSAPDGSLNLANAGNGTVTVNDMQAGQAVHVGGNGPTTINHPAGDITIVNDGPAPVTVAGIADDAHVTTSGAGDITLADPTGGVSLDNHGGGTVTVDGLNNNQTLHVAGDGPTTVANPDGDLAVVNGGPGTATVTGLNDGASLLMSGSGAVTVSAPEGDLALVNSGSGAATVEHLGSGAALTVTSASSTLVSAPLGDATLHNLGSGLMTVAGAQPDSVLNVTGHGAYALDLAGFPDNGHITLNNVDGASLQVLHAPAGATIDAIGAGDTTIMAPTGDLHIHNAGSGTMLVEQPADGITVTKTGGGPALIDHPLGGFTLANADTGAVTVQHLAAGATLVLEGSGPVVVDSSLAQGQHVTIDTSGNSNVQLANNGKGVIDVLGDLRLDSGDGMSIHLNGASTTAMTVAGGINLDGTPLHLTLDPNYSAHLGDTITLLDNDGGDAVVGTFANLAEGAPIYLGGSLFRISYVGGSGNDVVLTRVNDSPTGVVAISGTATQYQTLTASNTIADTDGMGTVSYRWLADGAMVAVGSSFALTQAEVGKAITLVASYTDAEGTVEQVTSSATAHVANVNDAPTGAVLIAGNATLGQTLVASNALADIDGMGLVHYQWQANGVNIAGATADSLVLTSATIGKTITAVASYTDAYGAAESVTSSGTVPVRDGNGVAPSTEALAPALHNGGLVGDGNGDGVLDALQSSVVSMAVAASSGSGSSYMTLVADSVGGKPVDGANPLSNVGSVHNALALPSWAQAPADAITFTSKVNASGATEDFSLYVDASLGVNGFWAKDAHGVLVNLASAPYGGQMVTEGDKVRLDFHIKEGSEFDAGTAGDTNIVSTGVAAHASLSLIGYVIDTPGTAGHGSAFD